MEVALELTQNEQKEKLLTIASKYLDSDEILSVALKGTFQEYLFCTNKRIYIIKKGYMTGHFFGEGIFKLDYFTITNVEVKIKLFFGYFELSAAGLENKDMDFWSADRKTSPQLQPNTVSITQKSYEFFKKASKFIMNYQNKKGRILV